MWATSNNHAGVVKVLLEFGASFTTRSARGIAAAAFVNGDNQTMVTLLNEIGEAMCSKQVGRTKGGYRTHTEKELPTLELLPSTSTSISTLVSSSFTVPHSSSSVSTHSLTSNSSSESTPTSTPTPDATPDATLTFVDAVDPLCLDDTSEFEASLQSTHQFVWDQCLWDQMFVFAEQDMQVILDTAITGFCLPTKNRQELWVPANIIFLSARYAHYYSSSELLSQLLSTATDKILEVIKLNQHNTHALAFWIVNVSQLLYYLRKDTGLVNTTVHCQLVLSELISETYGSLVTDTEQRLERILEPAMLDYEQITGLEQVDFTDDWHRFFRRSRTSKTEKEVLVGQSSPESVTSLLSSILYVLKSYQVHPSIVTQATAQFFYFLSCETFNRILMNKKFLCRSKALQIRMNLSAIEEWVRQNGQVASFGPLIQLLQLLQCVSQLNELELFIQTIKTFDALNPLQIKRCVLHYRYEVNEQRLPEEIEKYCMQIAQDTLRSAQQRQSCESTDHSRPSSVASRKRSSRSSRPNSVSSIGSLGVSFAEDEEGGREWLVEKRDSRLLLPFHLPNEPLQETVDGSIQANCVIPNISEEWMELLDRTTQHQQNKPRAGMEM
ncbi:DIL domain-containing protein [Spinellus fusiger]|nr:DIL domain-containing protein [Spinellus fusiger]